MKKSLSRSMFVPIPGFHPYCVNQKGEVWDEILQRKKKILKDNKVLLCLEGFSYQYPVDLLLILAGFAPKNFVFKRIVVGLKKAGFVRENVKRVRVCNEDKFC